MIDLTAAEVAAAVDGTLRGGDPGTIVRSVATDSRALGDDALFVALRGEHADGHDFVGPALDAGARAVLVERPVASGAVTIEVDDAWRALAQLGAAVRRRVDPTVVAITGSVGKTTTKDLTAAALRAARRTVAAHGSYNNELGVPLTLLATTVGTEALVVEIGARGVGHVAALAGFVAPDVAVVTAVAAVHLELFGTLDAIMRAKRELVESLPPSGTAVLNGDDPRVRAMAEGRDVAVVRYGVATSDVDVTATDLELDRLARPRFQARTPWGDASVRLPVAGRHQVGNALAALSAAAVAGVPVAAAAAALEQAAVSAWRGEVVEAGGVVILNDAYNSSPTAAAAALDSLGTIRRTGASWAVLGVMAEIGPTHEAEHRRVGGLAADAGIDHLIVVGDAAAPLADGAADRGAGDRCVRVADAAAAAAALTPEPGDVVLIKASRVAGLEHVAQALMDRLGRDPAAGGEGGPTP